MHRAILAAAVLCVLFSSLLLLPITTVNSQSPTKTPNLDATATKAQSIINKQMTSTSISATKTFTRQYKPAAFAQLKRLAISGTPHNVTFSGITGQLLDGQTAWVKIAGGFVRVHSDLPFGAQTGNKIVVYASVNGMIDLVIGGQPARIPNIEHAIIVNTGKLASLSAVEPTGIPPTKTPTPLPIPTVPPPQGAVCPNTSYTCSQLTCEQAYACLAAGVSRLDRDHDGIPCESVCGG